VGAKHQNVLNRFCTRAVSNVIYEIFLLQESVVTVGALPLRHCSTNRLWNSDVSCDGLGTVMVPSCTSHRLLSTILFLAGWGLHWGCGRVGGSDTLFTVI
jgi:hypothetical protein